MNYELFLAKRIAFRQEKGELISRPIIRIALVAIALGFSVMIIAVSIVTGFKEEIRNKVIGFSSHIQISNYDENNSYETKPVQIDPSLIRQLEKDPEVKHVQLFATKAGIVKNNDQLEGVVAKGIDNHFDWTFFQEKLVSGNIFQVSDTKNDSILISKNLADKLELKTGDPLVMYFIQRPPRARKFFISGIYNTGLEEFDNLYLFCDLRHLQKLNDWDSTQTGGYEITIKNFNNLKETGERVYQLTGSELNAKTVDEIYPQIFDWLGLMNINAVIIITLMIIVSGINMISALLIIILERVKMIGTLKSIGAENPSVRKIFIYLASFLIGRGLLWGNLIGLLFIFLQKQFSFFHLDQQSYYISYVPAHFSIYHILLLNVGTLFVCTLMMIIPTKIITRISPLNALRYN